MTKFQTAQERHPRNVWSYDPSVIFALHEDPITDVTELIACSSGSPEDILIALEELAQDNDLLDCIEQQLATSNNTGRHYFDQIAPTSTNIQDKDKSPMARACHEWRHV